MRLPLIIALTLTLAGCGKAADQTTTSTKDEVAAVAADAAASPPATAEMAPQVDRAVGPATENPAVPAGVPMLAYSYNYAIEASPKAVRTLSARHEAACAAAGAAVCQVTGLEMGERGEDQLTATLYIRATPVWLKRFRAGLESEAKSAGGRVTRSGVSSEDLSRQIVDTEAALRAKTTLRDRLQGLLASRPGKLGELIELERELARVQGEIDASQSELQMMRMRVATSDLTIRYESAGVLAPQGVLSPLAGALSDFLGILVFTLAGMIRFIAWTAPWIVLGGVLLWLFRKRLPRLRRRKAEQDAPPPA